MFAVLSCLVVPKSWDLLQVCTEMAVTSLWICKMGIHKLVIFISAIKGLQLFQIGHKEILGRRQNLQQYFNVMVSPQELLEWAVRKYTTFHDHVILPPLFLRFVSVRSHCKRKCNDSSVVWEPLFTELNSQTYESTTDFKS